MNDVKVSTEYVRGKLLHDEPMSRHTTWRLGGPTDLYFVPADRDDLVAFLQANPGLEVHFVGLGSNLLVRDGGVRGAVVNMTNAIADVREQEPGVLLIDAGVPCALVSRKIRQAGYTGLEFMSGIPGTIGGALAMNAGAHGAETWNYVHSVLTINKQGEIKHRDRHEFTIAYRTVQGLGKDEWFLAAEFKLPKGDETESKAKVKTLLEHRSQTQPTKLPNAGSVFKNPEGQFAAQLLEGCGLKGTCIGGACVSDKHANFIINNGSAVAADVEQLIEIMKTTVLSQHNIELHTEVRIIGVP